MSRTFRLRRAKNRYGVWIKVEPYHKVVDSSMGLWYLPSQTESYNVMRQVVEIPINPIAALPDGQRHGYADQFWLAFRKPAPAGVKLQQSVKARLAPGDWLHDPYDKWKYWYPVSRALVLNDRTRNRFLDFSVIPLDSLIGGRRRSRRFSRRRYHEKHRHTYCHMTGTNYETSFEAYEHEERLARKTFNKKQRERPSKS